MNIVFFHGNGIVPTAGGISRITDILGTLFYTKGNNVWYIGVEDKHNGAVYKEWQYFLPSSQLFSEDNIEYMSNFLTEHKIDVVVNQMALDPRSAKFLKKCKNNNNFQLVSCLHNSILTPVLNGAYQKEYILKKKGMGLLFHLMKTSLVTSIMTIAYICKYRKNYLSTLNNSDRIVVLCEGQAQELFNICGIKSSDKVKIIPNCIDTKVDFIEPKEKTVIWVGTFDYSIKRPDNMLRIWQKVEANHPDWNLKMLGDGISLNEMKILSKSLGLKRVYFVGRVNPDEYFKKASILCVTSVHESFSLVTVEAQRVGCIPILNNSFRPAPLLVQNSENGFLVPAFDIETFANRLSILMEDSKMRNRMSKICIEKVKRFSLDSIYEEWKSLFKER